MNRRDDRADIGRLVERIATRKFAMRAAAWRTAVGGAFRDQEPGTRAADLALIKPDRVDHAFHGAVEIGIVEHDERGFAAELERQFSRAGGTLRIPAHLSRTGEGDLIDARMSTSARRWPSP